MNKIKVITQSEATKIIDAMEPFGMFVLRVNSQLGRPYVGIDNKTGNAWVEEFSSLYRCLRWLTEIDEHPRLNETQQQRQSLCERIKSAKARSREARHSNHGSQARGDYGVNDDRT